MNPTCSSNNYFDSSQNSDVNVLNQKLLNSYVDNYQMAQGVHFNPHLHCSQNYQKINPDCCTSTFYESQEIPSVSNTTNVRNTPETSIIIPSNHHISQKTQSVLTGKVFVNPNYNKNKVYVDPKVMYNINSLSQQTSPNLLKNKQYVSML